jgi:hypothetical protein
MNIRENAPYDGRRPRPQFLPARLSAQNFQHTVVNTKIVRYVAVILQIEDGPDCVIANFGAAGS